MTGTQWGVPLWLPAVEGAAAAAFAVVAVVTADRPATVMASVAAVILAAFTARDLLVRVRLSADLDAVIVVQGFAGRRQVPWADVVAIRLGGRGRFGTSTSLLEIDTGDTVHLLSRREIGADLAAVARTLEALRASAVNL